MFSSIPVKQFSMSCNHCHIAGSFITVNEKVKAYIEIGVEKDLTSYP